MKSRFIRSMITFVLVVMVAVIFIIIKWPDRYAHFVFCDVGQGDAILIHHGFFQILIDSGEDDRVLTCLSNNLPFWDRSIELVIATHYDADHIGGFKYVFDTYSVCSVLTLPFEDDSEDFLDFKNNLNKEIGNGAKLIKPFLGQKIGLSSGEVLTVISNLASLARYLPDETPSIEYGYEDSNKTTDKTDVGQYEIFNKREKSGETTERILSDLFFRDVDIDKDKNALSIALLLEYKNTKVILTGDLDQEQEKAMIDLGLTTKVNLLKVGHHGSNSSSSLDFINLLQPEFAIISSGKNNSYGHPDVEILNRFSDLGINVVRTDERGEIKFASNGIYYWLEE